MVLVLTFSRSVGHFMETLRTGSSLRVAMRVVVTDSDGGLRSVGARCERVTGTGEGWILSVAWHRLRVRVQQKLP